MIFFGICGHRRIKLYSHTTQQVLKTMSVYFVLWSLVIYFLLFMDVYTFYIFAIQTQDHRLQASTCAPNRRYWSCIRVTFYSEKYSKYIATYRNTSCKHVYSMEYKVVFNIT